MRLAIQEIWWHGPRGRAATGRHVSDPRHRHKRAGGIDPGRRVSAPAPRETGIPTAVSDRRPSRGRRDCITCPFTRVVTSQSGGSLLHPQHFPDNGDLFHEEWRYLYAAPFTG